MHAAPMILPIDNDGKIYAIQDERGNTIGTGTREVCEVLLHIMTQAAGNRTGQTNAPGRSRPNVRAAIPI